MYGVQGTDWLNNLNRITSYFIQKWELINLITCENLSYNYVAIAHSKKYASDVVLKISIDSIAISHEARTLSYYRGAGCVSLIDYDVEKNALLLERIAPGVSLKNLFPQDDSKAAIEAAHVIKKLHQNPLDVQNSEFPKIADWLTSLNITNEKIPQLMLFKARDLAAQLLSSQKEIYLLHGDLHHENILYDDRYSWIAIDPKGVVGELAYEIGAFIRNPFPEILYQSNTKEIIHMRLGIFSKQFDIEKQRLIDWCYVQSILAACWMLEDNLSAWEQWIHCAHLIEMSQ